MNTTTAQSISVSNKLRQTASVLVPVAAATALVDFLFWRGGIGLSVGVCFAGIGVLLLASLRQRPPLRLLIVSAMLLACCLQSAIEVSLSNILASIALTAALAGEVFQPHLTTLWARVSEVAFGLLLAPFRWVRVAADATLGLAGERAAAASLLGQGARAIWVLAPAVVLVGVFAIIFGSGNAVFANLVENAHHAAMEWLANFDLSFARCLFWAFTATVALGIFHGLRAPDSPRCWTFTLPRVLRPDHRLATWQSAAVLVALNGLFCFVNTIDAIYLWAGGPLPAGVWHSEFVHQGVWSLTGAVVLSAFVIAGLFQQEDRVADRRWLKNLAHLWVVQNLVLVAGVFLRLKLYVVFDNQLTEKRVYVACFLLLVSAGFVFLAWFVEKRRTFNWLLGRNAMATFLLLFILQFPDVRGMIARCNTALWIAAAQDRDPESFDLEYNASLGPGAWSQLSVLAASERAPRLAARAREKLAAFRRQESAAAAAENWRDWQGRRTWARAGLLVATGEMP